MEGFDVVLLGSFYALPQFAQKYGHQLPNGTWTVTAAWQAGLSNGAQVGSRDLWQDVYTERNSGR